MRLPYSPAPAPEAVAEAVELLRNARRPAVIAGGGLRGIAPSAALAAFAERAGVPVFHPGMIVGAMPADHPNNAWSARGLAALTGDGRGPDAVLLVGARFGFYLGGRGGGTVPLDAAVVQVDLDGAEIGRIRPADVGIVADATRTLQALTEAWWPIDDSAERAEWLATATGWPPGRPRSPTSPSTSRAGSPLPRRAGRRYEHSTPAPRSSSTAVRSRLGHDGDGRGEAAARRSAAATWATWAPRRASAIGAQIAEPERRVVLLIGDGGAGFHIQEFDTMVRHGLPIVTIVVNNESWAMSLHGQQLMYGPETEVISGLSDTDFDRVAAGFGAFGVRVDTLAEVGPAVRAALDHGGPACVNLAVSGEVAHPVTASMLGSPGQGGTVLPYYENLKDSS